MTIHRTTLRADADDLSVLRIEARRRGLSLGRLLEEMVEREAAAIRASRRPTIGVVNRPVGIAQAMEDEPEGPVLSEFRSP